MSNVSKLKTGKTGGPPPEVEAPGNTKQAPRDKPVTKGKIEFSVDEKIIEAFCQEAGKQFGFKKGAKSEMFLRLWNDYSRKS